MSMSLRVYESPSLRVYPSLRFTLYALRFFVGLSFFTLYASLYLLTPHPFKKSSLLQLSLSSAENCHGAPLFSILLKTAFSSPGADASSITR
jgi:hypothetical protein